MVTNIRTHEIFYQKTHISYSQDTAKITLQEYYSKAEALQAASTLRAITLRDRALRVTAGVLLSAQQPRGIALLLSHYKIPECLNSFSALAEKILFSTPHFSHFPAFWGQILKYLELSILIIFEAGNLQNLSPDTPKSLLESSWIDFKAF